MFKYAYVMPAHHKWLSRLIGVFHFAGGTYFAYSSLFFHFTTKGDLGFVVELTMAMLCYLICYLCLKAPGRKLSTIITDKQIKTSFSDGTLMIDFRYLIVEWDQVILIDMRNYAPRVGWDIILDIHYLCADTKRTAKISQRLSYYGYQEFKKLIEMIKTKEKEIPFTPDFYRTEHLFLEVQKILPQSLTGMVHFFWKCITDK